MRPSVSSWETGEGAGPSEKPRGAMSSFLVPVVSAFPSPCIIPLALWRSKHTGIGECRKWRVGVKPCPGPRGISCNLYNLTQCRNPKLFLFGFPGIIFLNAFKGIFLVCFLES